MSGTTEAEPSLALFDDILERGASIDTLLQTAATAAQATVGVVLPTGERHTCTPHGARRNIDIPDHAHSVTLESGTTAWSTGSPGTPFLRRLSVTAVVLGREARKTESRSPLMTALLGARSTDSERSGAAKRLNLSEGDKVRVVLGRGERSPWIRFEKSLASICEIVATGRLDMRFVAVVRIQTPDPLVLDAVPRGLRVSSGLALSPDHAREAYLSAADAFRFALPSPSDHGPYPHTSGTFACADGLGALVALCRIAPDDLDVPDVNAIGELVAQHGQPILVVLEAFASTDSLRKAAAVAYMHHNSVAYWVARAQEVLDYDLSLPYNRARLMIGLCLFRLRNSPG